MAHATRFDHDDCLRVCHQHRDTLTNSDLITLNIVAGAYACNERIDAGTLRKARGIVDQHRNQASNQ